MDRCHAGDKPAQIDVSLGADRFANIAADRLMAYLLRARRIMLARI